MVGLVLAVGLLPLVIGIVFVQRGADNYADESTRRALAGEARTQATNLESYFGRSRSVILLAARDAAIPKLVNTPAGRREQLRSRQDLDAVNGAQAKTPFFAPTAALRPGQVFQAAPLRVTGHQRVGHQQFDTRARSRLPRRDAAFRGDGRELPAPGRGQRPALQRRRG